MLLSLASIQMWEPVNTAYEVQFTAQERQWLRDNPIIRVAIDPDFAPMNFTREAKRKALAWTTWSI